MFPQWVAKNTEFLPTGWEHQIKLKVANVTIMWSHNDSKLGQRNHVWYEIVLGRSLENTYLQTDFLTWIRDWFGSAR